MFNTQEANTQLLKAAENGDTEQVKSLLEQKADVDAKDRAGDTPLGWAAYNGHSSVASLLLVHKASVDVKNQIGNTPLNWAATNGHLAVASLLLDYKASVDMEENENATPLIKTIANGHLSVASLLLDHKASVDVRDNNSTTPLSSAASTGNASLVSLLLTHKASVDMEGPFGATPLNCAAKKGHLSVTSLLLAHKASVDMEDKDGDTPLGWAAYSCHPSVASLLLAHKASVDVKNNNGDTPLSSVQNRNQATLSLAKRTNRAPTITLLQNYPAFIQARSGLNNPALEIAWAPLVGYVNALGSTEDIDAFLAQASKHHATLRQYYDGSEFTKSWEAPISAVLCFNALHAFLTIANIPQPGLTRLVLSYLVPSDYQADALLTQQLAAIAQDNLTYVKNVHPDGATFVEQFACLAARSLDEPSQANQHQNQDKKAEAHSKSMAPLPAADPTITPSTDERVLLTKVRTMKIAEFLAYAASAKKLHQGDHKNELPPAAWEMVFTKALEDKDVRSCILLSVCHPKLATLAPDLSALSNEKELGDFFQEIKDGSGDISAIKSAFLTPGSLVQQLYAPPVPTPATNLSFSSVYANPKSDSVQERWQAICAWANPAANPVTSFASPPDPAPQSATQPAAVAPPGSSH